MAWARGASEAMRLRAMVLRVLSQPEAPIDPEAWQHALECPASTWKLFLTAERCAIHLERELKRAGRVESLPESVVDVLRQRARHELARVLSAKNQLRGLGELATRLGARPVVLKGGCSVLEGTPLDLSDIDLLLPSDQAARLAAALDAQGHEATFSNPQHLRARLAPQALPVEIHITLDQAGGPPDERLREGVTPIPESPGLWRLAPAEHLWHVLRHAAIDHPTRRGRLRDLLLIADAARASSSDDLAAVAERARQHSDREALEDVLAMALGIAQGVPAPDRFGRVALAHYLVRQTTERLAITHERSRDLAEATLALVQGKREISALWRQRVVQRTQEPSPYRIIARVERRVPVLGRALRVSVRAAYRTGVLAAAAPIATLAFWLGRRHPSHLPEPHLD